MVTPRFAVGARVRRPRDVFADPEEYAWVSGEVTAAALIDGRWVYSVRWDDYITSSHGYLAHGLWPNTEQETKSCPSR